MFVPDGLRDSIRISLNLRGGSEVGREFGFRSELQIEGRKTCSRMNSGVIGKYDLREGFIPGGKVFRIENFLKSSLDGLI